MIYGILIFLHVVVSALLVITILLQSSKGGGLAGSAFGGGAASTLLGARGTATFLSRATTILAVIFMLNSLGLSLMGKGFGKPRSVTQQEIQSGAQNLPRVPTASDFATPGVNPEVPITTPPGTPGTAAPTEGQSSAGGEAQKEDQTSKPQL
jgi:preprotein translocase subunit SecG